MNIYKLRSIGSIKNFLRSELLHFTDKIAGSFSTAAIAFSFLTHLVTTNARIVAVNEKHTTTAKIIGDPVFEMDSWLVKSLIILVQKNPLDSFVRERFSEGLGVNFLHIIRHWLRCTPVYFIAAQQTIVGQLNEIEIPAFVP